MVAKYSADFRAPVVMVHVPTAAPRSRGQAQGTPSALSVENLVALLFCYAVPILQPGTPLHTFYAFRVSGRPSRAQGSVLGAMCFAPTARVGVLFRPLLRRGVLPTAAFLFSDSLVIFLSPNANPRVLADAATSRFVFPIRAESKLSVRFGLPAPGARFTSHSETKPCTKR